MVSVQLYDVPIEVFMELILPEMEYSTLQRLTETSKTMRTYIDRDCVWRTFVRLIDIPWKDEDFYNQDTGGTSIRYMLSERMEEVAQFKSFEVNNNGEEIERLVDPKGLLQNVANQMHYPYHIIDIGYVS